MAASSALCPHVHILFAPRPDDLLPAEESAAFEFARRGSEMIKSTMADNARVSIDISGLDDATKLFDLIQANGWIFLVLIVSCDADGSVHRDVRKLTRQLNSSQEIPGLLGEQNNRIVVVLLGHAICHNSSNQMESEIFRVGRKLAKLVGAEKKKGTLLETQVELESPQARFDPFMQKHGREIMLANM